MQYQKKDTVKGEKRNLDICALLQQTQCSSRLSFASLELGK